MESARTFLGRVSRAPAFVLRIIRAHALELASGAAAATPIISSTVKAVQAGWMPAGDDGIIATRGWDVLTSHSPLVGQYSEAGQVIAGQNMHSPGPMLYWLIALPAHLGSVQSIAVTMGALNTLAVVGCVVLARRRGGLVLMFATALGIALMCQSLAGEAMHDIWNPAAGLFAFLLLVFVCWSIACGARRLLPLAALDASYVVQTHLMYLLPTLFLLALACFWMAAPRLRRRRPAEARSGSRVRPWALLALVLAVACWTPPLADELQSSPGNMTTIVRTATHRGPTLGGAIGWHAVSRSVGVRPWWLYVPGSEWERKFDVRAPSGGLRTASTIAILALLAALALVAARARRRDLALAATIGLGLSGAIGLQAASNPSGRLLAETLGYTMWWGSEVGLWVWLTLAWGVWLALAALVRGRIPWRPRLSALASVLALAGVAGTGLAVAGTEKPDSHSYDYRPIDALGREIERAIPAHGTIGFHLGKLDAATQPMEPAIRFLLVRRGDRPLADGSFPRLGSYYVEDGRRVSWVLYLTDGTRVPRGMTLAGRVRFRSPWGAELLSAWVRRA